MSFLSKFLSTTLGFILSFWLNAVEPFLTFHTGFNVISTGVRVLPGRSGEIPHGRGIFFVPVSKASLPLGGDPPRASILGIRI